MINPPDKSESQNQANENPVDSKFTRDALSLHTAEYNLERVQWRFHSLHGQGRTDADLVD